MAVTEGEELLADGRMPSAGSSVLVRRTRVLELLRGSASARAICLQAPGGYGKSTALRQWLAEDPRPALWLGVQPEAADAGWLVRSLLDALTQAGLLDEPLSLPLSVDPVAWTAGVLPAVERALSGIGQPFVVVIDDAGELTGDLWDSLLDSIVRRIPHGAHVAIATRGPVPRPMRRLRATQALVTVGPAQLALDQAEASQLLGALGVQAPQETVTALLAATEGWPVALYLAALALRSHPVGSAGPARAVRDRTVSDYLRDEILDRVAPSDARFLLRASVLTYLDEPTCSAVTGTDSSLARLRRLSADNNLLVALDGEQTRFRMHALLAEFLSDEFRATDPSGWRSVHGMASVLREQRGDIDAAAHHAKLAGDDQRLGELLWSHAGPVLARSRAAVLRRWLAGVSDERITGVCELALCAAWLASHEGDLIRMERLTIAAAAACERQGGIRAVDVGLLRATIGADGIDQIRSAAQAFIAERESDDPWLTLAHFLLGVSLVLGGETQPGLVALERGARLARALDLPVMRSHCLAAQADVWLSAGQTTRALPLIREARLVMIQDRLDHIATAAPVFTTSAAGYLAEGRLAEARREAMRALRQSSRMDPIAPWYAVQGRVTLAEVFFTLGDFDRCHALLTEADQFRGPAARSPVLDQAYQRARQRLDGLGARPGDVEVLTAAEVRVLQYLPTHLSFPAMAQEMNLSPFTVKSQALSAYRKLGAHSRGEAIRRAREIGLLSEP